MKEGSVKLNIVALMWPERSHTCIGHRHKNTDWSSVNHLWKVVTTAITQNTTNPISLVVMDCMENYVLQLSTGKKMPFVAKSH